VAVYKTVAQWQNYLAVSATGREEEFWNSSLFSRTLYSDVKNQYWKDKEAPASR